MGSGGFWVWADSGFHCAQLEMRNYKCVITAQQMREREKIGSADVGTISQTRESVKTW